LPISEEEWNSGNKTDTFEMQILSFLRKNRSSAFTLSEIVTSLGYKIEIRNFESFVGGVTGYWLFQNAVENLLKEGTVEARKMKQDAGEQIYYRAI
jgi:hypothetical protein